MKPGFQWFNKVWMWHELKMKDGSEEKMMPLFWLHADCNECMVIKNDTGLVLRIWWNTAINKWLGKVVDETNQL